jgi:hypothetical protein
MIIAYLEFDPATPDAYLIIAIGGDVKLTNASTGAAYYAGQTLTEAQAHEFSVTGGYKISTQLTGKGPFPTPY